MGVERVDMFKVVCDEPGCTTESYDLDGDFAAWQDAGGAIDAWQVYDGQLTDDGKTYCPRHFKEED